jgi:hypothetical protein
VIQFVCNLLQHSLGIGQHVVIPKPQHSIACLGQKLSPPLIRLNLAGVLPTVKLEYQPALRTKEVHDVATDWLLAPELETV